mgnify:CR=1 FL=1
MQYDDRYFSLGLLKPDCTERDLLDTALQMVRAAGLEIVALKPIKMTAEDVVAFYPQVLKEEFFDEMSLFLQSGISIAYIVKGEDAIGILDELVGETDPADAEPGTIRSMGESIRRNLAHSSDGQESFLREASVIWSDDELERIGVKTRLPSDW